MLSNRFLLLRWHRPLRALTAPPVFPNATRPRSRPIRFSIVNVYQPKGTAGHRYVGDKRSGTVYDLESVPTDDSPAAPGQTPRAVIDELLASGQYLCFAPDTLAEARNRGYRLRGG